MSPEVIFRICNMIALAGWLVLLASPFIPKLADRISTLVVPVLLAIAYTGLILAHWSGAEGGFDSLPSVMLLFTQREIVLAGWIHYLAFDLLIGAWEVRTARAERIPFLLAIPCLALTFLFGPAGYLAFTGLRAARRMIRSNAHVIHGASQ
ncbi:ABA4-like family protein [Dongia deserti]|uniref:ABA4-like family protein n=1 Tax=Dongia deserti TaxID=2268030 RepID=UPI000E6524A5|nr:ABA4-like family protein [Dongia deserti]